MDVANFVNGLADAGMPFADDHPDYCAEHGQWHCDQDHTPRVNVSWSKTLHFSVTLTPAQVRELGLPIPEPGTIENQYKANVLPVIALEQANEPVRHEWSSFEIHTPNDGDHS